MKDLRRYFQRGAAFGILAGLALAAPAQMTDVLTFHNDVARTGQATNEQILSPQNVNTNNFGLQWILPVDGLVYAQPLYAAGVNIPGLGQRNVVFIETENDSAYAFDADSTNLFWHTSLLEDDHIPFQTNNCAIMPEIGITATPVIDRQFGSNGAIFMEAMSQSSSTRSYQRLYALDLGTGARLLGPVDVTGRYPGTGDNSVNGTNIFVSAPFMERAALLLLNGEIYTAWQAHCDEHPSTSWVIGFEEQTLTQSQVMNLEPNSSWGSIWNSGGGPAADPQGNIYVVTGNGNFDDWYAGVNAEGFPVNSDFGNSLVKLIVTNSQLKVADYFTMYDVITQDANDQDLSSGCAVVLPNMTNSSGAIKQLVVIAAKDQNIYLANRTNLGKYNGENNNALYQELTNVMLDTNGDPPATGPGQQPSRGGIWCTPAYFNGTLYYGINNGWLTAFPFAQARLQTASSRSSAVYINRGATPSISANGISNAILWAEQMTATNAALHAYQATNLAEELYNSSQETNGRDYFGAGQKFATLTIASARVYVATTNAVAVFGLINEATLTPIQIWRNNNFGNPSNVGRGANSAAPAGDGVPNLIKYALGLEPFTPATNALLSEATLLSAGTNYLTATVNRSAQPPDAIITAQFSTNLITWTSSTNALSIVANTPNKFTVLYNQPMAGTTNGYIRLLFSQGGEP